MPSEKKMIGLRLDDDTYAQVAQLAAAELRPMANMVEILVRAGLRDTKARIDQAAATEAREWDKIVAAHPEIDWKDLPRLTEEEQLHITRPAETPATRHKPRKVNSRPAKKRR